jgi:hypothetical protein
VNGSRGCGFGVRWCSKLLVVCLNSSVMRVVSLSVYVNVAQDRAVGFFSGCEGSCGVDFWGQIGKELLCRMLWIFSSCWYSAGCSW